MRYLGKKSLSSFLKGFCRVSWFAVLIMAVIAGVIGAYLAFTPVDDPLLVRIAGATGMDLGDKDWITFKNLPVAVRMLIFPWFIAVVVLTLEVIKKTRLLFANFTNNIVFDPANVQTIAKLGKLLIPFSILTVNISSLIVSFLLLLLCEIFKSGAVLQQEHDLTV